MVVRTFELGSEDPTGASVPKPQAELLINVVARPDRVSILGSPDPGLLSKRDISAPEALQNVVGVLLEASASALVSL
jgi:hypothetical protein